MTVSGSRTVANITSNRTFVLTVAGPGGTATCQTAVTVTVPPPSCTLSANPTTIENTGFSTLSWSSSNGASATLTTIGSVPLTGSAIVTPAVTTTYTLTVLGQNGQTVTCQTIVTVRPVPNAPSCTLSANPSSIQSGGSTVLNWSSSNAVSASFNQGIGSVGVSGSRTESAITSNRTYVLTVTGSNRQTATCEAPVTVTTPSAPSCTIYANPTDVQSGGSSTLTWTSTNGTSATINQGIGSVSLNGSYTVSNITQNKTFVLTVTGSNGQTVNCETRVVVTQIPNPPACTLTANPTQVQSGGSTSLVWTSTNASSASFDNGIGSVGVNGSYSVSNITSNRTYTLTVMGSNGQTATCQTSIVVTQIPSAPSCTLSANPNNVNYGGSSTLTWSSNNAISAMLDNGIGSVGVNGSYVVSNVTSNRTYSLTVTGSNGQTATCQAPIVVQQQNVTPSCTISASPYSITQGQSVTLYWSSTNASSAFINPNVGTVGTAGSMQVFPQGNSTYTLTVMGTNGQTVTCQTSVVVQNIVNQVPYCTIYANPTSVQRGQSAMITWTSQNAQSAQLSSVGSVGVNGSMNVTPYQPTTYTLTVWSATGQQATCSASIQMNQPPYFPPPTYYPPQPPIYYPPQPPTIYPPIQYYPPNIPISYIPYTGQGSPIGNIVLFGLIVAASLSGAYLLLYSRGGAREMLAQAGLLRA